MSSVNSETVVPNETVVASEPVVEEQAIEEQAEEGQETEEQETGETGETESQEQETNEDEQYSKRVQKRINQFRSSLTKAETERQEAQAKAAALELRLQELQAGKQPEPHKAPVYDTDTPPNPDDFDAGIYDPDYLIALTDYKVEQKFAQQQKNAILAEKQRNVITLQEAAKQAHPDYATAEQAFLSHPLATVDAFKTMLFESENPVELSYYLGKNPDELDKIGQMSEPQALRYIGRIEAKIATQPSLEPVKKPVSNAPKPITPLGSAKSATVVTDISEARDMAEYVRLRKAQQK